MGSVAAGDGHGCCRHLAMALFLLGIVGVAGRTLQVPLAEDLDVSSGLCATLVQPWGYPCTEYTVQTEDGFLLGVQNIPYGAIQPPSSLPRKPVFLQHGIFAGGDNWVFNQPSESLGFILADAGFDVWIGNIRCVEWSHGHISLTPDDSEFWNWSWDELAAYDLPSMISFVYNQTNNSQVLYVGHSQGTSILMASVVGTSQAQAMASMLAGTVMICPVVFLSNLSSGFDKYAANYYGDLIMDIFGVQEFNLHNAVFQKLIQDVCENPSVNCTNLFDAVVGTDCCRNESLVPFYLNFFPQPTSIMNLAHFAQMIRKGTFNKFDYGLIGNLEHYKSTTPPPYKVANFPASLPLMIIQGGQDALADPIDVLYLVGLLGSKVNKLFAVDRYNHGDFVVSTTANVDVYPEIISFLQNPIG